MGSLQSQPDQEQQENDEQNQEHYEYLPKNFVPIEISNDLEVLSKSDIDNIDLKNQEILNNLKPASFQERAFGCILGGYVANWNVNSLSNKQNESEIEQENAVQVNVKKFSMDIELSFTQIYGIIEGNKYHRKYLEQEEKQFQDNVLDIDAISCYYQKWVQAQLLDDKPKIYRGLRALNQDYRAFHAKEAAFENNHGSQDSDPLIRAAPIIVWASKIKDTEEFCQAIISDTELSHSNLLVHDAIKIYSLAIRYLLNNPEDSNRAQNAFLMAKQYSQSNLCEFNSSHDSQSCHKWLILALQLNNLGANNEDLFDMSFIQQHINCNDNQRWIQRPFVLSFMFLLRYNFFVQLKVEDKFYSDTINQVISLGGNVEANTTIVGSMIGALIGVNAIPRTEIINKVIQHEEPVSDSKRDQLTWLDFRMNGLFNIEEMLQCMPRARLTLKRAQWRDGKVLQAYVKKDKGLF